jgi:hypothetical protein
MGRPINKRNFGVNANNNLKVQFFNGTASVPGFILRQRGHAKFLCEDKNGNTAICFLVDQAANTLTAGQMTITLKLDNGVVGHATRIAANRATINGVSYAWNFSASTSDAAAQVEEAGEVDPGPDAVLGTADDVVVTPSTDLEGDEAI